MLAASAVARYLVALWAAEKIATTFPYGTVIVNLIGSCLIALILELSIRISSFPPNLRIELTTAFMGGPTTYSSFNYESTQVLGEGQLGRGLLNIGITLIGCLLAGGFRIFLARRSG